ncbi:MAG: restriction endonuclease PLD domain-containing protein [Candidatus Eremiobacterota bacterium]
MLLKEGLYEQLINKCFAKEIEKIDVERFEARKEKVDVAESDLILSKYLQEVIQKSLKFFNSKEKFYNQVDLCNELIQFIISKTGFTDLYDYIIPPDIELLFAISKINRFTPSEIIRPISPLSQSSLFTGAPNEPSLASEIKKEILTSDRIDILVSFIKWSGIRIFQEEFKIFTNKPDSSLRLITTSYMGATDYKAIEFLSTLPNTTIKVSYDTKRTRLHAKAYLFYRDTGFTTAYIGSSNISNPAMTSGLEWNIKVRGEIV